MDEQRLRLLFQKFIDKTISEKEKEDFMLLVAEPGAMPLLRAFAEKYDIRENEQTKLPDKAAQRILHAILQKNINTRDVQPKKRFFHIRMVRFSAAAAVLFLVMIGSYRLVHKNKNIKHTPTGNLVIKDAEPGHTGAILTLSNGQSFLLDTTRSGALATGIVKSEKMLRVSGSSNVPYATLATPFGRQQRLQLSDGTVAWLNAGSSIRFPTMFSGDERIVEITGEVYFEVVHNAKQPFVVKAGNEIIRDIGTSFDVNAYSDEPAIKTTLLKGSVQIGKSILKPGEQYTNGRIAKVDADAVVAWVSGYFQFEQTDIQTVMKQLSRWYNVNVSYEGKIPAQLFEGEIQRSLKLSQVLDLLSGTGIHYTLDGNKLIIRP